MPFDSQGRPLNHNKRPTRHDGTVIRQERIKLGMTTAELAERVGMSYKAINNIENGLRDTRPEMLHRIARALGVPIASIMRSNGNGEHRQESHE